MIKWSAPVFYHFYDKLWGHWSYLAMIKSLVDYNRRNFFKWNSQMSLRWYDEIYNTYLFICLLLHRICKLEQQKDYKLFIYYYKHTLSLRSSKKYSLLLWLAILYADSVYEWVSDDKSECSLLDEWPIRWQGSDVSGHLLTTLRAYHKLHDSVWVLSSLPAAHWG